MQNCGQCRCTGGAVPCEVALAEPPLVSDQGGLGSIPLAALAQALAGVQKLDAALDPPSAIATRAAG
jgi:hypothetical protein